MVWSIGICLECVESVEAYFSAIEYSLGLYFVFQILCAHLYICFEISLFRGDCNSCVLTVGGSRMKPCVDKVPPEPRLKSLQENGLAIK